MHTTRIIAIFLALCAVLGALAWYAPSRDSGPSVVSTKQVLQTEAEPEAADSFDVASTSNPRLNDVEATSKPSIDTAQDSVEAGATQGAPNTIKNSSTEVDSVIVPVYTEGTVFTAMRAHAERDASFTFSGRQYPGIGFFVESIGGVRANGGLYWILYVNGRSSDLGASAMQVAPGDLVEWRFEPSIY